MVCLATPRFLYGDIIPQLYAQIEEVVPIPFGKISPDQKGEKMSVLFPSDEKR